MARSTALWRIARYVEEITFLFAFWADIGGSICCDKESTLTAFPVSLVALGTYISYKLARCRIAAHCTHMIVCFLLHVNSLLSSGFL